MRKQMACFLSCLASMAATAAAVKLSGWGGPPVEFEVQERYLAARGNRTAVDFTIADEGAWAPSGAASNCVKRTDEPRPYVRFGGDDKRVGLSHGVKPAKPVPLEAGVSCMLEVSARVARGTDTIIVYMRAFDADGHDVTASAPAPSGWSYSIYSKCYVKYPLSLDACGKWTTLKVPFRVPEGVTKVTPMVCPWRGGGADVRGMRIVQGPVVKARTVSFDAPVRHVGNTTLFRSSLRIDESPVFEPVPHPEAHVFRNLQSFFGDSLVIHMRSYIYQPGQLFVHDIIWSPDPVPIVIWPIHLNQGAMCGRYGVEITVSIFSIIFLIFIEGLPSALHFPQLIFRRIVPCLQITAKRVTPGESPLLALPKAVHHDPHPG